MNENNNDSQPLSNDFEFNNGIGDALKEKEEYAFSWPKTISVLLIGSIVIIASTFGILELGKRIFKVNTMQQVVDQDALDSFDINELADDVNNDQWEVLPITTNKDTKPVAQSMDEKPQDSGSKIKTVKEPESTSTVKEKNTVPVQPIVQTKPIASPKKQFNTKANAKKIAQKPLVFRVIAGSFKDFSNAESQLRTLKRKQFDGYIFTEVIDGVMVHRIQAGAFSSKKNAELLINQLARHDVKSYIIH